MENRPRIPSQRGQYGAADDLPFVPRPPGPPRSRQPSQRLLRPDPPARLLPAVTDPMAAYDHGTLKSLLGAWALAACSREEALAVEVHLTECAACAEEALRLRDAVGLLHREESLDLDPLLRARVLEGCLGRRPAAHPGAGVGRALRRGDRPARRLAARPGRRLLEGAGAPAVVRRRPGARRSTPWAG